MFIYKKILYLQDYKDTWTNDNSRIYYLPYYKYKYDKYKNTFFIYQNVVEQENKKIIINFIIYFEKKKALFGDFFHLILTHKFRKIDWEARKKNCGYVCQTLPRQKQTHKHTDTYLNKHTKNKHIPKQAHKHPCEHARTHLPAEI